jgi:(p)ppGpp synthase/HD superfamily hydrolase
LDLGPAEVDASTRQHGEETCYPLALATIGSDPGFTRRSPLLEEAYRFAAEAHAHQRSESDGGPYIRHPLAVARLVCEAGYDDEVVAAALLHDTVEDTDVSEGEIRRRFGRPIADLVAALTEPADMEPFEARKEAHRRQVVEADAMPSRSSRPTRSPTPRTFALRSPLTGRASSRSA